MYHSEFAAANDEFANLGEYDRSQMVIFSVHECYNNRRSGEK